MVAEILAGIALAKTAVSGIKSVIDTAKDVNDVAHFVDDLFKGYDQSRHAARKAQEKAKMPLCARKCPLFQSPRKCDIKRSISKSHNTHFSKWGI